MEEKTVNPLSRGLFMILLGMLYSLAGTVLLAVAVVQFIFLIAGGAPNSRLSSFGHSLGEYVRQIVDFQTFVTEKMPFPFSDWP